MFYDMGCNDFLPGKGLKMWS